MGTASVLIYDVKLPDRIEPYEILAASIRRNDAVAFVCDVLMPADIQGIALRHYSFPDRWWSADVSVDLEGAPLTGFGPDSGYAFDCDITTPHFAAFGALCNIDQKLDVFIRPDGREHIVVDQDDFDRAVAAGWIDDHDRREAERGLNELLDLIDRGGFVAFLENISPRCPVRDTAEVKILAHRSTTDLPVIDHWQARRSSRDT